MTPAMAGVIILACLLSGIIMLGRINMGPKPVRRVIQPKPIYKFVKPIRRLCAYHASLVKLAGVALLDQINCDECKKKR